MLTNQTGHYYFNLLSEVEKNRFKNNFVKQRGINNFELRQNEIFDDLQEYIKYGTFPWGDSNEGWDYWEEISERKFNEQPKEPTNSELYTMIVELKKEMNMLKSHLNIQE